MTPRDQRGAISNGILALIVLLVVMQLWLLSATMNAYLGGDETVLWPAALASILLFLANLRLLTLVRTLR